MGFDAGRSMFGRFRFHRANRPLLHRLPLAFQVTFLCIGMRVEYSTDAPEMSSVEKVVAILLVATVMFSSITVLVCEYVLEYILSHEIGSALSWDATRFKGAHRALCKLLRWIDVSDYGRLHWAIIERHRFDMMYTSCPEIPRFLASLGLDPSIDDVHVLSAAVFAIMPKIQVNKEMVVNEAGLGQGLKTLALEVSTDDLMPMGCSHLSESDFLNLCLGRLYPFLHNLMVKKRATKLFASWAPDPKGRISRSCFREATKRMGIKLSNHEVNPNAHARHGVAHWCPRWVCWLADVADHLLTQPGSERFRIQEYVVREYEDREPRSLCPRQADSSRADAWPMETQRASR